VRHSLRIRRLGVRVPPSAPCDVSRHRNDPEPPVRVRGLRFGGLVLGGTPGFSGGLVSAVGVEGEFAEQFAGGGVDDADVQVLDEQQDAGPGVGPADAEVVEAAAVAEGDLAGGVDAVGADAVVGVGGAITGGGLGPGVVGGGGGGLVRQGPVRAVVVVAAGEGVQESLEGGEVSGLGVLGASQFFSVCWNRSALPWVWG